MTPLKIVVNGEHTLIRIPELASVTLHAAADGRAKEAVFGEINDAFESIQDTIKNLAILDEHNHPSPASPITESTVLPIVSRAIKLQDIYRNPQTNQPNIHGNLQPNPLNTPVINRASFFVEIKFRNLTALHEFIRGLTTTPVIQVQNIDWHLSKDTHDSSVSKVRSMALNDAIKKADICAGALGRKVVPVRVRAHHVEIEARSHPMLLDRFSVNDSDVNPLWPRVIVYKHRVKVTFGDA